MINILIVNDDGINSEGLLALANVLNNKNYNVTVVAPNGNRSGYSHSLNFYKDIFINEENISSYFKSYSISGTPVDCVKYAVHQLNEKFDLVVSGINHGANLGSDILYSGTVGACLEANFFKIKSIAFSNISHDKINFDETVKIIDKYFEMIFDCAGVNYTLNVNIPNISLKDIKGIKVCKIGVQHYSDGYQLQSNGAYQLVGTPLEPSDDDFDTDVYFANKGFVTVSPLSYSQTDINIFKTIKDKIK